MGRVIIDQYDYHRNVNRLSMKCKSEERAFEIQAKLPNVKSWKYYDGYVNARLIDRKKPAKPEISIEDQMKMAGLI